MLINPVGTPGRIRMMRIFLNINNIRREQTSRRDVSFRFVSFHAFQEVLLAVRLLQWTWEDVEGRFPFPRPIREHLGTCSFGGEKSGGPVTIAASLYRSSIARDLRVDLSITRWFPSILVDFHINFYSTR